MTSAQPFNWDFKFDPPEQPEVTASDRWHQAGEHEDFRYWGKQGCTECEELAESLTATVELKFTRGDLENARYWFKRYGHKYGNPQTDRELILMWALKEIVEYKEVI